MEFNSKMQNFYGKNLQLVHCYLKVMLKSEIDVDDAVTLLNTEIQKLVEDSDGKLLHTKLFTQTIPHSNNHKKSQVRCYIVYKKQPFANKE